MNYAAAVMLIMLLAMLACGSGGEGDCDSLYRPYDSCYATGAETVVNACGVETTAGVCERPLYWLCYIDNECSDTNDTDTIAKLEACLAANAACE